MLPCVSISGAQTQWLLTRSPAVRSDTPSELITIDRDYLDRINLRKQLMKEHGSKTHGCLSNGEDAVQEVYSHLLADYLPQRYPIMFQLSEDHKTVKNLVTGDPHSTTPPPDTRSALRALGSTVEEDLFLLKETPEGHQCVAFVCCFPSGWDPASKLGKLLVQIHDGVPSYNKIGPSMERFFSKLEVGRSVKRNNVSAELPMRQGLCPLTGFLVDGPDVQGFVRHLGQPFKR
jgi:hypothetical protein